MIVDLDEAPDGDIGPVVPPPSARRPGAASRRCRRLPIATAAPSRAESRIASSTSSTCRPSAPLARCGVPSRTARQRSCSPSPRALSPPLGDERERLVVGARPRRRTPVRRTCSGRRRERAVAAGDLDAVACGAVGVEARDERGQDAAVVLEHGGDAGRLDDRELGPGPRPGGDAAALARPRGERRDAPDRARRARPRWPPRRGRCRAAGRRGRRTGRRATGATLGRRAEHAHLQRSPACRSRRRRAPPSASGCRRRGTCRARSRPARRPPPPRRAPRAPRSTLVASGFSV